LVGGVFLVLMHFSKTQSGLEFRLLYFEPCPG